MQLLINVSEELIEYFTKHNCMNDDGWFLHSSELLNAFRNGIPLPKGHGRLIEDTPELERELWTYIRYTGIDEAPYESAVKVIDEAPTIIGACTLADADTETWNGRRR